jgi:selenocysteine-specific elongation factor
VLRDAGRILTFGGGVVLDPLPGKVNLELLRSLDGADDETTLRAIVEHEGEIDRAEVLLRSGSVDVPDDITQLGHQVVAHSRLDDLRSRLVDILETYHRGNPLEAGMPLERARTESKLEDRAFDELVQLTEGVIEEGRTVRRESHRVVLAPEQERARSELLSTLDEHAFTPPVESELQVDRALLGSLTQAGEVVRISNFYLTRERGQEAQRLVRDFIEDNGPATVAQIRDLLGTTRKYAVPLSEWLDATGTTIRRGDVRVLGPRAKSLPR